MTTVEELTQIFSYEISNQDNDDTKVHLVLSFLRNKLPKEIFPRIITETNQNILYLVSLTKALKFLTVEDLTFLRDNHVFISWYSDSFTITIN
jgi:hypothetical protein